MFKTTKHIGDYMDKDNMRKMTDAITKEGDSAMGRVQEVADNA